MRKLIALVIFAALAWSGWWVFASQAQKIALETWFEQRRNAGWIAEVDSVNVTGYPNRIDTNITELHLAYPQQGWAWKVPRFNIMALSYKPNHIIFTWPQEQVLSTTLDTMTINSIMAQGSVIFKPETSLALDRLQLEIKDIIVQSNNDWSVSAKHVNAAIFATSKTNTNSQPYDMFIKATDFIPPARWRATIRNASVLSEEIPLVSIDARLYFDRQWDRISIETINPNLERIELRETKLDWGTLSIRATGDLEVRKDHYIDGEITIQAKQWKEVLSLAVATGAIDEAYAAPLEQALSLIASLSGNPNNIDVSLTFEDGTTYLGPIPIGAAPQIK